MIENSGASWKSLLFVALQFIALGYIGLTGLVLPGSSILLLIELIGMGLGAWAVLVMGIGNFNIIPDPSQWTKLVRVGPYQLIRHPMYLALLLTTLPMVINYFTVFRFLVWITLLVTLLLKLNNEEGLLSEKLNGYLQYVGESYKIIPFLY